MSEKWEGSPTKSIGTGELFKTQREQTITTKTGIFSTKALCYTPSCSVPIFDWLVGSHDANEITLPRKRTDVTPRKQGMGNEKCITRGYFQLKARVGVYAKFKYWNSHFDQEVCVGTLTLRRTYRRMNLLSTWKSRLARYLRPNTLHVRESSPK